MIWRSSSFHSFAVSTSNSFIVIVGVQPNGAGVLSLSMILLINSASSDGEPCKWLSLETIVSVVWTPTHTRYHTPSPQNTAVGKILCCFFRPAGLVHIALTFPVHKGETFPLACQCDRTRLYCLKKTFALEHKVYFLILCNKTTVGGRSIVSRCVFVFYLCLFIDFCQHALPLRPRSFNVETLRQVVERSEKLQAFNSQQSFVKPHPDFPPTQWHILLSGSRTNLVTLIVLDGFSYALRFQNVRASVGTNTYWWSSTWSSVKSYKPVLTFKVWTFILPLTMIRYSFVY